MQTQEQTRKRNGVDVIRLKETLGAIQGDPELATFRFRARNEWKDCGHNRSTIQDFYGCKQEDASREEPFVFDADEPNILLGENKGANPVEFLLHALAACVTTAMVYHAAARGITLESVESTLEGDIDLQGFLGLSEDVPKGYRNIEVSFKVKSDATPEQLAELTKFSPVYNTLTQGVPVNVNVETVS